MIENAPCGQDEWIFIVYRLGRIVGAHRAELPQSAREFPNMQDGCARMITIGAGPLQAADVGLIVFSIGDNIQPARPAIPKAIIRRRVKPLPFIDSVFCRVIYQVSAITSAFISKFSRQPMLTGNQSVNDTIHYGCESHTSPIACVDFAILYATA